MEFASASSTASALLFDRTKLAGRTVSVAIVEEALPAETWELFEEKEEGEELFEKVEHDETTSAFLASDRGGSSRPAPVSAAPVPSKAALPPTLSIRRSAVWYLVCHVPKIIRYGLIVIILIRF